ncbi:YIP1 family protein [Desulfoferrobacter suflitae]|uniref:YIP1 family protein n=1 Tax=Desulfoferrobacter suflitae TaxID=2865782 RepID=UPI002164629E|nr:YIP1 family protein [Desulfoferrobacter suflitae]MCK8603035.1 YIP1 family protein [Desulfoferrobacter suflitae]
MSMQNRMIRAAKLDAHLYEEVEADAGAMYQAMSVVVLASIASGIGMIEQVGIGGLVMGTLAALLGWYVWAYLAYLIGTKLIPEPQTHADFGQLLRTTGFSSSPGVIRILGIIPGLTGIVFLLAAIWMLAAMVIAIRQALDYKSTLRAVGVCAIGWIIQAVFLAFLLSLMGGVGGVPAD